MLTVLIPFPVLTALALVTAPLLALLVLASPLTMFSVHTTFVDGLLTLLIRTDIPMLEMLTFPFPRHESVVPAVDDRDELTLREDLLVHLLSARLIGNMILRGTMARPGLSYVISVRVPAMGHLGMLVVPMAMSSSPLELPRALLLETSTILEFDDELSILRAGFGFLIAHVDGSTTAIIVSTMVTVLVKHSSERELRQPWTCESVSRVRSRPPLRTPVTFFTTRN